MVTITIQKQPVPALGFGTWPLKGEECRRSVEHALALGYRHIDTAQGYENEVEVGRGMRNAGVARDQIFLVTKVRPQNFTYDKTLQSSRESLRKLASGYIDLLLLHWPNANVPVAETMQAMRKLQDEGVIRHIGVSNFSPAQVEEAARHATIFCNQVEYHPYLAQNELLAQARQLDYLFVAYSPLARGKVFNDPTLKSISVAHAKTVPQVVLRWLIQQGVATIPKAGSDQHRKDNFEIFDFTLTDEEMQAIDGLSAKSYSVHT
jgi:diketogulonate reductase-like aldo/keto reductase